jgi:branched-chain amino acid transport system permease protein
LTSPRFTALVLGIASLAIVGTVGLVRNEYFFSAAYTVLQFVVLASAWNILGGFTGYVNFGSAAFFALGVYSSVVVHSLFVEAPIALSIAAGTLVAALVGLGMGYLTLRLRGVFFAIATLAFAQVLLTFIVNWEYVGGARGAYLVLRGPPPGFRSNAQFLFAIMATMAAASLALARWVQTSTMGLGLAAIRDDEVAAECSGVPTLRLKLVSTTLSGGLMGMAGATFPYFLLYVEPSGVFSLSYAVNSIAMPLIGGMHSWAGPLLGALLLGIAQQVLQVTVSADWNLFLVGALLVLFVTVAPEGIMGWTRRRGRAREAPP